ncbi:MAG: hypothetical protein AAFZ74_08970 [Pseudomonadota bacterium]
MNDRLLVTVLTAGRALARLSLVILIPTQLHASAQEFRCSLPPSLVVENAVELSEDEKKTIRQYVLIYELKRNSKFDLVVSLETGFAEFVPHLKSETTTFEPQIWELSNREPVRQNERAENLEARTEWTFERRGTKEYPEFITLAENSVHGTSEPVTYALELKSRKPDFLGTMSNMSTTRYICMHQQDVGRDQSDLPEDIACSIDDFPERFRSLAGEGMYWCGEPGGDNELPR